MEPIIDELPEDETETQIGAIQSREYQMELYEMAKTQNLIICLPTGSGKTWISLLLTRYYLPICIENKKKVIFLANTVQLVIQQFHYFEANIPSGRVSHFAGYMNLDSWNSEFWQTKLSEADVFIMSTRIFLDILNKEITLDQVALLIFDECHHADKFHDMNGIMNDYARKPAGYAFPRILGLTATIIKGIPQGSPILKEIERMEQTMVAKAITYREYEKVLKFSTNAKIRTSFYEGGYTKANVQLSELDAVLKGLFTDPEEHATVKKAIFDHSVRRDERYTNNKSLYMDLKNDVVVLQDIYNKLGPSCARIGAEILIVAATLELKLVSKPEHILVYEVYMSGLCEFVATVILELLDGNEELSPKIRKLMEELRSYRSQELCGIVFVERKLDCQVLNWFFQDLAKQEPEWSFLKPNFLTAIDNDYGYVSETTRVTYRIQRDIIQGFRKKEYNLLFSTAVLEEGLDVPSCNLIVRFDRVSSYRSYAQSMGRARSKDSEFVVFINSREKADGLRLLELYKQTSIQLADALILNALHVGDEVECVAREDEIPPFCPGGKPNSPRVTATDAIQLINSYCQTLGDNSRDMLGANTPVSWRREIVSPDSNETLYKAFLVLPRLAVTTECHFEGQAMKSKRGAKRSVYLEACRRLYEAGGLDELLRPVRATIDPSVLEFFETQEPLAPDNLLPKGWYRKSTPEWFGEFNSRFPGGPTYTLYEVQIELISPVGIEKEKYFDYSTKRFTTGFLSATSLDMIPTFRIESRLGAMRVDLKNLSQFVPPMALTDEMIGVLKGYQMNLFSHILRLTLNCAEEIQNQDIPLWVVPIRKVEGLNYSIDLDIMKGLERVYAGGTLDPVYMQSVPEEDRRIPEDDIHFTEVHGGYENAVLVPWHNENEMGKFYCVLEVVRNNPGLVYPAPDIAVAYQDFYPRVKITRSDQPSLRCYAAHYTLDYLSVRGRQNKKADRGIQIFLPELVRTFVLPSGVYSQAFMMPSIIHRIHRFLIAMGLGAKIANSSLSLKHPTYKPWDQWGKEFIGEVKEVNPVEPELLSLNPSCSAGIISSPFVDKFSLDLKYFHPRTITLKQIEEAFSQTKRRKIDAPSLSAMEWDADSSSARQRMVPSLSDVVGSCHEFSNPRHITDTRVTPPIYEILEAITLAGAKDRFSLERLEVIGDSFLKYFTTLFIYGMFPEYTEGKLTELRGKLVSNQHLKRFGEAKGLGGILAGGIFDPALSFLPPSFTTKEKCAAAGMESGAGLDTFYDLTNVEIENMSTEELVNHAKAAKSSNSNNRTNYGYSKLREKDLADCVEALIGAYYVSGGQAGALPVMEWLGIRGPDREGNPVAFGTQTVHTPTRKSTTNKGNPRTFVPNIHQVEELLQYKFKNPWLLVEAFTHANDTRNDVTDSFQRLEFLGDAVLDFLVTHYIFKNSDAKTPGEITDLRSALVNNVTFGSLSVRYEFHKHLLHSSREVQIAIETFATLQANVNHQVLGQFLLLTEYESPTAKDVEVPKVLGDIFESICGAVFIDSGMNLDVTWTIFYRLMKNEIDIFFKKCPMAPIRHMREKGYKIHIFTNPPLMGCKINTGKDREFTGFGTSKRSAMDAAAKLALRYTTKGTR